MGFEILDPLNHVCPCWLCVHCVILRHNTFDTQSTTFNVYSYHKVVQFFVLLPLQHSAYTQISVPRLLCMHLLQLGLINSTTFCTDFPNTT